MAKYTDTTRCQQQPPSARQLNPAAVRPARIGTPLSLLTTAPLVLVTQADKPAGADYLLAARNAGNKWSYGSVGIGSVGHLGVEYLKLRAGNPSTPCIVPYNNNPAVITRAHPGPDPDGAGAFGPGFGG